MSIFVLHIAVVGLQSFNELQSSVLAFAFAFVLFSIFPAHSVKGLHLQLLLAFELLHILPFRSSIFLRERLLYFERLIILNPYYLI